MIGKSGKRYVAECKIHAYLYLASEAAVKLPKSEKAN